MNTQGICFVIMGYGKKTDYSTGKEFDLDKTYKNIIKPSVGSTGLKCVRSDDLRHSGIIDVQMYKYILTADVVIADLSTNNPNALYELGIRHALKPYTTIAISENGLAYPFDLNHTVIRKYEHLGTDIGYDETLRFREELTNVISEILSSPQIDSPVYTFLRGLNPPSFELLENEAVSVGESLSEILEQANKALEADDFLTAKVLFTQARAIDMNNPYLVQKLALCTYKSKRPTHVDALQEAWKILEFLNPYTTTDPETLGLSGAIYKRLWEETGQIEALHKSIGYYERGFFIKRDYYNGVNLAFLLNVRGSNSDKNNAIADYVLAERVRREVIDICNFLLESEFDSRTDGYWILATLEEAYYGLGDMENYNKVQKKAVEKVREPWQRKTTVEQIQKLSELLVKSPLSGG